MARSNLRENIKNIVYKLSSISNSKNDTELAKILNTNPNTFSSWKNTTKLIPIDTLIDFCNKYDISLDFLLKNDGLVNLETNPDTLSIRYSKNISDAIKQSGSVDFINIPLKIYPLQKYNNTSDIRAIKSTSNEFPITIPEDISIMLLDFSMNIISTTPKIFLIKKNDRYFIRRVYIAPNNRYSLSAENKNIEDIYIDLGEIEFIATLKGVLKWQK